MKKDFMKAIKCGLIGLALVVPSANAFALEAELDFYPSIKDCIVQDNQAPTLIRREYILYNFNYGAIVSQAKNNYSSSKAVSMPFSDIYTDVVKNRINRAYNTLPEGKCPAPRFRD